MKKLKEKMFAAFAANVKTMESLRRNEVKYVPGVLRLEKVIVLSAADYEKLAEDISPEYPFLKDNRTLMTAQPGGTFHCLLVTAETEQEGMLFALTENTLYTGRAQNVPGMELQGIPVERITLEKPKAYQEHAVFFHRARGLDDITGRDVRRPVPERQTSFRVELAVVLSDAQFRQFKECGLMEDKLFLFENSSRMWFDPGELCWHCLLIKGESSRDGILVEAEGYAYARYAAYVPDCGRLRLKDVPVRYEPPARRPEHRKKKAGMRHGEETGACDPAASGQKGAGIP